MSALAYLKGQNMNAANEYGYNKTVQEACTSRGGDDQSNMTT